MMHVGDILSTVEGYLEYRGGVQYRGDIMRDILSTVGMNMLLSKAELRANIHPLRTRELNKCSVTGQTH